jgi:hypothetical protein
LTISDETVWLHYPTEHEPQIRPSPAIEKEAALLFHEAGRRLFRPKPRWMPKAVWNLIVGIILVK